MAIRLLNIEQIFATDHDGVVTKIHSRELLALHPSTEIVKQIKDNKYIISILLLCPHPHDLKKINKPGKSDVDKLQRHAHTSSS